MSFRTMMLAGPTKANELFARLSETSDGAVKTREKLFSELKAELGPVDNYREAMTAAARKMLARKLVSVLS